MYLIYVGPQEGPSSLVGPCGMSEQSTLGQHNSLFGSQLNETYVCQLEAAWMSETLTPSHDVHIGVHRERLHGRNIGRPFRNPMQYSMQEVCLWFDDIMTLRHLRCNSGCGNVTATAP